MKPADKSRNNPVDVPEGRRIGSERKGLPASAEELLAMPEPPLVQQGSVAFLKKNGYGDFVSGGLPECHHQLGAIGFFCIKARERDALVWLYLKKHAKDPKFGSFLLEIPCGSAGELDAADVEYLGQCLSERRKDLSHLKALVCEPRTLEYYGLPAIGAVLNFGFVSLTLREVLLDASSSLDGFLQALSESKTLKTIDFSEATIRGRALKPLFSTLKNKRGLEWLILKNVRFSGIYNESFKGVDNFLENRSIVRLDVTGIDCVKFKEYLPECIAENETLRRFIAHDPAVESIALCRALGEHPQLISLKLVNWSASNLESMIMSRGPQIRNWLELDVSLSGQNEALPTNWCSLLISNTSKLKILSLAGRLVSEDDKRQLEQLMSRLQQLTHLDVHGCGFAAWQVRQASEVSDSLQMLKVEHLDFEGDGRKKIEDKLRSNLDKFYERQKKTPPVEGVGLITECRPQDLL